MSDSALSLFTSTFGSEPTQLAFAPGRIEFIGNHTDYNGGLVMGVAVTEGITVAVKKREDRIISIISDSGSRVERSLDGISPLNGAKAWTNYPAGVTKVLLDAGVDMPVGYEMAVSSTLPAGAGMSSSAAFELATAQALAALYGYETDKAGFARIGRKAENEFVGVPCGILDQGVSAFGEKDHIVAIDCATEVFTTRAMPTGGHFWIFDSNHKHSLVESHYADRNRECHEALAVLQRIDPSKVSLSEFDEASVRAAEAELGDVLFRRALHIVGENARVCAVEAALVAADLNAVGIALFESHESSRVNFENSIPELDFLVNSLKGQSHLYGARLTGGGFGGAVMAFTDSEFGAAEVNAVKKAYAEQFGSPPTVFHTQAGQGARLL